MFSYSIRSGGKGCPLRSRASSVVLFSSHSLKPWHQGRWVQKRIDRMAEADGQTKSRKGKQRHRLVQIVCFESCSHCVAPCITSVFFSLSNCSCASWMDVTVAAIDLHSRHPSVVERDFLLVDPTRSQHCITRRGTS